MSFSTKILAPLLIASLLGGGCSMFRKKAPTAEAPPPVESGNVVVTEPYTAPMSQTPVAPKSVALKVAPEVYTAGGTLWLDFAPLPGVKYAVFFGDPFGASIYTMRLKFPDGYTVQPHTQARTESITVISGTLNLGGGDRFSRETTTPIPAGGFFAMDSETRYFFWTQGDTILQLNGVGPWDIKFTNPPLHQTKK